MKTYPAPGTIKSIQAGTISGTGGATATITAVNTAKSICFFNGSNTSSGAGTGTVVLTNATTVTSTVSVTAGTGAAAFTVVEYY